MADSSPLCGLDGSLYARPPLHDVGLDFDFELSEDISETSLQVDKPTGSECPVHALRAMYFMRLRRCRARKDVQHQQDRAPLSDASRRSADPGEKKFGGPLHGYARQRLEPRWYEITPDAGRDDLLRAVMARPSVSQAWGQIRHLLDNGMPAKEVLEENIALHNPSHAGPSKSTEECNTLAGDAAVFGPEQDDVGPQRTEADKADEAAMLMKEKKARALDHELERRLQAFAQSFRDEMRKQNSDLATVPNDGWGTCRADGNLEVGNTNTIDVERNKPDLPFFSNLPELPGKEHAHWKDISSFISVKFVASEDLSIGVTNKSLQLQEELVRCHPLTMRSHHVTVCGWRVRLWSITPGAYATSRAYSFWKAEDQIHIARIFALLTVARPKVLLQQWAFPNRFTVEPCEDTQAGEEDKEEWEWLAGWPKVIDARSDLWGSRTLMLAGKAKLVAPATRTSAARHASLDLHGVEEGVYTMGKCVLLPLRLRVHELSMQQFLATLPTTPNPIGEMRLDDATRAATTFYTGEHGEGVSPSSLHVLVYQHRLGLIIPQELSERSLCTLWAQLTAELMAYSERGAHYRDLNEGNLLYQPIDGALPRALVVDHGNMRLNLQQKIAVVGPADGRQAPDDFWKDLFAIAKDDARSANPLFLPSSMWYVHQAMEIVRCDVPVRSRLSLAPGTWEKSESDEELRQHRAAKSQVLLHAHTYLDDLESACYLLLWQGVKRSFPSGRRRRIKFLQILTDAGEKRLRWEGPIQWCHLLRVYCTAMSSAWRHMMEDLNFLIAHAQEKRRERIRKWVTSKLQDLSVDEDGLELQEKRIKEDIESAVTEAAEANVLGPLEELLVQDHKESALQAAALEADSVESSTDVGRRRLAAIAKQICEAIGRRRKVRTQKKFLQERRARYERRALYLLDFSDGDRRCFQQCIDIYERYLRLDGTKSQRPGLREREFGDADVFPYETDRAERSYEEEDWEERPKYVPKAPKRRLEDQLAESHNQDTAKGRILALLRNRREARVALLRDGAKALPHRVSKENGRRSSAAPRPS